MPVERTSASHVDLLDHVLDKGIVIDAWVYVTLAGIDLLAVETHLVVASIETHMKQGEVVSYARPWRRSDL